MRQGAGRLAAANAALKRHSTRRGYNYCGAALSDSPPLGARFEGNGCNPILQLTCCNKHLVTRLAGLTTRPSNLEEDAHVSQTRFHFERLHAHHRALGARRNLLYARRAEDAGLVWRLWLPRHDGVLYPADGDSCAAGVPGNLRRILRWPWTSGWSAQPNCRARNHRQYAGRHRHRPPRQWLPHELERPAKG